LLNKDEIAALLETSGLGAYRDAVAAFVRPSLQLRLRPAADDDIAVGASKIGGDPDLPAGTVWPSYNGCYHSFVAQFDLAEMPPLDPLPRGGMLYVFHAIELLYEFEWNESVDHRAAKVVYVPPEDASPLFRTPPPDKESPEIRLAPNAVEFVPTWCPPASESADLESIGLGWSRNRADFDKYWGVFLPSLRERMPEQQQPYLHRLLGNPDPIQGDMQTSCVLSLRAIEGGSELATGTETTAAESAEARDTIVAQAVEWRLLFQLDSEEEKTGVMFGDVGRLYLWIREDDLRSLRFDRVVWHMQCT